jgi:hypothetical protein
MGSQAIEFVVKIYVQDLGGFGYFGNIGSNSDKELTLFVTIEIIKI